MRVAVFCGSSDGSSPSYLELARDFGAYLGSNGYDVVYGGGNVGLMGAVADSALKAGAKVTGIIPEALFDKEIGHNGLTSLEVVPNMHVRKERMAELSDAFVVLPGGIGTLEEIYEQWTWAQLGIHKKPCAILNINGYYDALIAMTDQMVSAGFLREEHKAMLIVSSDPGELMQRIKEYKPVIDKWGNDIASGVKP